MVKKLRKRNCSLINLKKLVYLISPKKIYKNFYTDLKKVLSYGNVKFFQLRIKNTHKNTIIKIAKKIKNITINYNVKLIVNDSVEIAEKIKADGFHLGQVDKKKIKLENYKNNMIIGVTCHGSKRLAQKTLKDKITYIAFGSFYKSKLKPNTKRADVKILKWSKENIKKPIVAIGGINDRNYRKLINKGANYIAISSFIWDNPTLKPEIAIKKFK